MYVCMYVCNMSEMLNILSLLMFVSDGCIYEQHQEMAAMSDSEKCV
jgi:hypothetical protein